MQMTSFDNLDSLGKILLISLLSSLPSFVILTLPALTQAVSIITVIIWMFRAQISKQWLLINHLCQVLKNYWQHLKDFLYACRFSQGRHSKSQFQVWLQNACHFSLGQNSKQNEQRDRKALCCHAIYFSFHIFLHRPYPCISYTY